MKARERLNLPLVAAVDELSQFEAIRDEEGRRLLDVFGWPKALTDQTIENYGGGRVLLSWGAIQTRFENLPFVWKIDQQPSADGLGARTSMSNPYSALGLTVALVVPAHMARGRLGLTLWCGTQSAETAQALLQQNGPYLLAITHYFFGLLPRKRDQAFLPQDRAQLSQREVDCLTHAASGNSYEEIGSALGISRHTARFHIENAAQKLGAKSRTHAIALAAQLGMIGSV